MKRIFTLLMVVLFSAAASAQYYQVPYINAGQNPGGLNNDAAQPSAAPTVAPGATDWSAAQTIPFSFDFNGTAYTQLYIAPSGIVTFSTVSGAAPSNANVAIPSAMVPDNSICMWGLDLSGANDAVEVIVYGNAPNRQYWISWKSASWAGIGATSWAYWSIVLEETSNTVYIVDERNYGGAGPELTAGLQFSATSAMSVTGSPALTSTNIATGGSDAGVIDNSYYAFFSGVQPDYDVAMTNLDVPAYVAVNSGNVNIKSTVTNFGAQAVTDLMLVYTVNGGPQITQFVTGLNIASGTSTDITHPTPWVPVSVGTNTIEYWASLVNGNTDENLLNDRTNGDVITYLNSYPRTVLYETFTSSTCAPCVAGNANFESVVANIPSAELTSVKYQMSWPGAGDPYNTADGNTRRSYYGINSVPRLEADGGWDGNSSSFTTVVHNDALIVPAFVNLEATYSVDLTTKTVSTCVTIRASQDLGAATLQLAITENKTFLNTGTNGETEFLHVLKKMIPNANGQSVIITNGMNQTICSDYTFQGNFRLPNDAGDLIDDAIEHSVEEFTDLAVVAWVQKSDLSVLNSTNAIFSTCNANDIVVAGTVIDNQATGSISITVSGVAPAPFTYSWTGPNGYTATTKDISGLADPGMYEVEVTDANGCSKTESYTVAGIVGGACAAADLVIYGNIIDNQDSGIVIIGVTGAAAPFTYSWTGPNGFTSTSQNISGLSDQGSYVLVVTDANGCTISETFEVGGIVTVEGLNLNENISLFPNPAVNNVTIAISIPDASTASIKVLDLVGKTVVNMNNINVNSGSNNIELNTANLNAGIYLVEVTINGEVSTSQLVIQK